MNPIQTQRVSIIITKRCTLKCKLCGALAPYVENYHPAFDFIKSEVDAFFRIVQRTGIIDISGGEPFIRGNKDDFALGDLLIYLCDTYNDKFDRVRIFTNGTVVPGNALCEVFRTISKKMKFNITIDNYGKHSPKVNVIADKLKSYEVAYDVRDYSDALHCGGWVDLLDITRKHDPASARELYQKCAIPQKLGCCLELMDGILSPCSVAASRYLCGEIGKDSNDIIDLFADLTETRNKLVEILNAEQFDSCQYCNGGMADDSPRYIPAEQATTDEIDVWKAQYKMRRWL
jgi:hypothetical protein